MAEHNNLYPLVSIISINYDHPEVTCQMLDSLRNITYPNVEVIIVDNASPKDDPSIIPARYPEVKFIQLEKNLGFAGGNNVGIRQAKGKYILLLNNDTEVTPDFLEPLVEKLEKNPEIGVVSPKIKFHHTPDTLQFTVITPINKFTGRSKGLGFGVKDTGQWEFDAETAYAHGAAMMVPRKVIEKVGLMAEIYFLYYEELDWCYRIRQAGYKIYYVHNSLVYHKESISTGKMSPTKIYWMNRARLLYMRRNVEQPILTLALLYQFLIAIPKNALMYLLKGRPDLFKAYHKAVMWHLQNWKNPEIHFNPKFYIL
ncbi:MAG: glycosyltransferase family 2 protein [Bacteroidales bacterium]|nr:glycosyltransferase family 2 protein [Bacteroidales bacterium]